MFALPEVQQLTRRDDLELGRLGERKQAIFCIIPDSNDASLNFLVGMLYTQAFQELYYQADKVHHGALPVPVRLLFDEFANIALPDGYARLQATMRSRNIMATIILQNISQLKELFKGRNGSYSRNFQQTGRELLTPDEVRRLDNRYAIALIRGEEPVMDEKYDLMRHPNLKYTEDGGAAPYIHSSTCLYGLSDDSVLAFADLNEIKILDESEEIYE